MAQKEGSVEKCLAALGDIPEDISEVGDEEIHDIESDNDDYSPVTNSSESEKDDDIEDPPGTISCLP